jgi:hypothetical protein
VLGQCLRELPSEQGGQAGEVRQAMNVWRQQHRQAYGPSLWPKPSHKPICPPATHPVLNTMMSLCRFGDSCTRRGRIYSEDAEGTQGSGSRGEQGTQVPKIDEQAK